jgi:phage RecT family recombinase
MATDIVVWQQSALTRPDAIRRIIDLPPSMSAIERSFPGDLTDPDRARKGRALVEQAYIHIANSQAADKLLRCTGESFVQSLADCAALDLSLHKAMGEAYLVPFGPACTLMPGYRGFITLMCRTGAVASVDVQAVYEGESCQFFSGTDPRVIHEQRYDIPRDYKHLKAVYMIARNVQGPPTIELMNMADIERVRKTSKAQNGPWSYWPEEMAKKSVIRRGQKKFPKRGDDKAWELLARASELDNRQFDVMREQAADALRERGRALRAQAEGQMLAAEPQPDETVNAEVVEPEPAPSREAAWKQHLAQAKGIPQDDINTAWLTMLKRVVPGKKQAEYTPDDWAAVIADIKAKESK